MQNNIESLKNSSFLNALDRVILETTNLDASHLSAILEAVPLCVNLWNSKTQNILCNNVAAELFELESKDEYLEKFYALSPEFQPDGRNSAEAAAYFIQQTRKTGFQKFYWLHCKLNGEEIPAEVTLHKLQVCDDEGEHLIAGFTRDLRPELMGNSDNNWSDGYFFNQISNRTMFNAIADLSAEWFYAYDNRTEKIQFFGAGIDILGLSPNVEPYPEKILEANLVYEDDMPIFMEIVEAFRNGINKPFDLRFVKPSGEVRYYRVSYKTILDINNKPLFVVGRISDINDQKSLEVLSQTDQLTNCFNKITTQNLISSALVNYKDSAHAFYIIDIDNFKTINDTFGHQFGDKVLYEVSRDLKKQFREEDIVGRLGGDEFIVFIKNITDLNLIRQKAQAVVDVLKKSFSTDNGTHSISASVGIALYPKDGTNYQDLYKSADKAQYRAKQNGKNCYAFYSNLSLQNDVQTFTLLERANRVANTYTDYNFIDSIFQIFSASVNKEESLHTALELIGKKFNIDRVHMIHNKGPELIKAFVYSSEDIEKYDKTDTVKDLAVIDKESFFNEIFLYDTVYDGSTVENKELNDLMLARNVKTLLLACTRVNNASIHITFSEFKQKRDWTEKEINSIRYVLKLLVLFLKD